MFFFFLSQKADATPAVPASEAKKEEKKKKEELSEAEKTALASDILDDIVGDVITSDTTQPSVPGIVLDTINDIIMSEVAIAKEEAAKEKEEKVKEEERHRKEEEKKKKEEEKKKKKQPASPPPVVIPGPTSPTSPKTPEKTSSPARQQSETQEANIDMRADGYDEQRNRKVETPKSLPSVIPGTQPSPESRTQSQNEPNITINGQNVPQDPVPVVLNGHVVTGQKETNRRQDSRDSVASHASSHRSGSHTPTTPTSPRTPSEEQRPVYNRAASQDSKRSSASAGKVRLSFYCFILLFYADD